MSVYSTEELLKMWSRGELTVEQSIGQMIQHQKTLYERLLQTERRLSTLISEVATANDRGNETTACSSKASKKHD